MVKSEKRTFSLRHIRQRQCEKRSRAAEIETWLFPFMNVFALFGSVDGDAPLDVNHPSSFDFSAAEGGAVIHPALRSSPFGQL